MPNEKEYRQLVSTVSLQFGADVAKIFEQVFRIAYSKHHCDICLHSDERFEDVTIGADFAYALEFEATVATVHEMLSQIKVVTSNTAPVVRIALHNIRAVVGMPKATLSEQDIKRVDVGKWLTKRNENGETLEEFILKAYRPKSETEMRYLAARYVTSLKMRP